MYPVIIIFFFFQRKTMSVEELKTDFLLLTWRFEDQFRWGQAGYKIHPQPSTIVDSLVSVA